MVNDRDFYKIIEGVVPESVDATLATRSTHSQTEHLVKDDSYTEDQTIVQNLERMVREQKKNVSLYMPYNGTSNATRKKALVEALKTNAEEIRSWENNNDDHSASMHEYNTGEALNIFAATEKETGICTIFDNKTGLFHSFATNGISVWLMPYQNGDIGCTLGTDYPAFSKDKAKIPTEDQVRMIKKETIDEAFASLSGKVAQTDKFLFVLNAKQDDNCSAQKERNPYNGKEEITIFRHLEEGKLILGFDEDGLTKAKLIQKDGKPKVFLTTRKDRDEAREQHPVARRETLRYMNVFKDVKNNCAMKLFAKEDMLEKQTEDHGPSEQVFGKKNRPERSQNLTIVSRGAKIIK